MAAIKSVWMFSLLTCMLPVLAQPTRHCEEKREAHVAEYVSAGNCASALKLVRSGLAIDSPRRMRRRAPDPTPVPPCGG